MDSLVNLLLLAGGAAGVTFSFAKPRAFVKGLFSGTSQSKGIGVSTLNGFIQWAAENHDAKEAQELIDAALKLREKCEGHEHGDS